MVKTIAQARQFVKKVKICTIFPSHKVKHTSLWENVDLPDKKPGEKGWGKKMNAVWTWKTRLPAEYPNDIYYGKIKSGLAVLMDMDYMARDHFPTAYKPVQSLDGLAQFVHKKVAEGPSDTAKLRGAAIDEFGCTKSRFDTALKKLQITMNIVRLNDPKVEQDTWVLFRELYLEVWERYEDD